MIYIPIRSFSPTRTSLSHHLEVVDEVLDILNEDGRYIFWHYFTFNLYYNYTIIYKSKYLEVLDD